MINSARRVEIRHKAEEVTQSAERFHMIHATYACQNLIKQVVMNDFKAKYDELSDKIEQKMAMDFNCEDELKDKERFSILLKQRTFHIDVEYINTMVDNAARVIKNDNSFVICLPQLLLENMIDKDGKYNQEVLAKIRKFMAHELGHLVLHTDDILKIDGTQGSLDIKDDEKEEEANLFGEKLIELRSKRNKRMYQDV